MGNMMHLVAFCGLMTLFPFLPAKESILLENLHLNTFGVGDGKKRKRGYDLCTLITQAHGLWEEAHSVLSQDEEGFPQPKRQACENRRKSNLQGCIGALDAHELYSGNVGLVHGLANRGLTRGRHIPVNDLIGQVAARTRTELQALLLDRKVQMVAIHGGNGIGKTMLMKHLYNYGLESNEMFDHAFFWVTCPDHFSIKDFQDAVAMAVKCDLSGILDSTLRARKLSQALLNHGKFVMFLDAVPEGNFSPERIGIPGASQKSCCKLVVTSCSPLACESLYDSRAFQVNPLSKKDSLQLLMSEAGIESGRVAQLNDIPQLLSEMCCGVPRTIVDIATQMCGIHDIREWKHKLNVGINNGISLEVNSNDELGRC